MPPSDDHGLPDTSLFFLRQVFSHVGQSLAMRSPHRTGAQDDF